MADSNSVTLSLGFDYRKSLSQLQKDLRSVERDISFSPKLNARNFTQPLGQITRNIDEFTGSLDAANKRVLAFGASAAAIGGTIKAFNELAKATIEVEKAFSEINSVFGLTSTQLSQFSKDLFKISRDTAQSFDVAAKAALEFSRQGLGVEETGKRVAAALTLSRQSGLDAAKSVDTLTAALNGFQRENLSAIQVVNKLIAVDTKFAVSSADLAEAISRVGSTSQDVGVDLDKLIGLVTAAQQITARGGAVIGNAFKTIFTRLGRSDTLEQIESLGVAIKDTSGAALSADQILKNLAGSFDTLTESQKSTVAELTAGVFEVNQLRAILGDLGRSYSIAEQATLASNKATDQATKRNELLNKSLASLLQNTKTTFTEIGSLIGQATFANPLKTLLGDLNEGSVTEYLNNIVTKKSGLSAGEQIGKGILEGIGNVLTGPGVAIAAGVLAKVAARTIRDVSGSAGSLLGPSTDRQREEKTIQGINVLLSQATQQEQQRYKIASSVEEKERIILGILEQQNAVRAAQNSSNNAVARSLISRNPTQARSLRQNINAAGGLLPIGAERKAINQGVGGARPTAKPVVIPNFAFGKGKYGTVVANTDEYLVPNFANGGSAIFNREMVGQYGLPNGARKINAAGGFVPNFNSDFESYLGSSNQDYLTLFKDLQKKDPKLAQYIIENGDKADLEAITSMTGIKRAIQITPRDLGTSTYFDLQKKPEDLRAKLSEVFGRYKSKSPLASGYIPNFALPGFEQYIGAGAYGSVSRGSGKNENLVFKQFRDEAPMGTPQDAIKNEYAISKILEKKGVPVAKVLGSLPQSLKQKGLIKEFVQGIGGQSLQEQAPDLYTGIRGKLRGKVENAGIRPIDLRGDNFITQTNPNEINLGKNLINNASSIKKYEKVIDIFARKSKIVDPGLFQRFAGGFIPNFANPLQDALKREKEAGIPVNQIYVDTDKRLKSQQNPMGLMVANRRDEPLNGAQGVNRVLKQGRDPKKSGMANGFIPNFAKLEDFLFTGGDKLRSEKGTFIDRTQLAAVNNALKQYASALDSNSKIYQNEAKKAIEGIGLTDEAQKEVLDTFDQLKAAKKQEAVEARKVAKETEKAAKQQKIEIEKRKKVFDEYLNPIAPTPKPGQLSAAQQASIKNAPIIANNSAPSISGPYQPNQTPNLAAKLSREADELVRKFKGAGSEITNFKKFLADAQALKLQRDTELGRKAFKEQNAFGRRSATFEGLISKNNQGEKLSRSESIFTTEILKRQGVSEGRSVLGKNASSDAINSFAEKYVQSQKAQLTKAFQNALENKNEVTQYNKLEKKLTGYRNIFTNIDKEIDRLVKGGTLSEKSGERLKQQSGQIRERRAARLQNAGLAASIVLPFVSSFIPQRQGGSEGAALRGGLSGGLQGAGTGAAIGSFFGPLGTAIGGIGGGIAGGIIGALQKSTKSLEEFSQVISDVNAKNQSQVDAIQQYIQIQQQLNEAIDRGASPGKRQAIQNRQAGVLSRIQDSEARRSLVASGGNIEKQFEVLQRFGDTVNKESQGRDIAQSLFAAGKGGFESKDIKNAVDTLVGATNTADKEIATAFTQFKNTFKDNPLDSFKEFSKAFKISGETLNDTVEQIKRNPNELRFIFQQVVETVDQFAKDAASAGKEANRNLIQANFGRALRQGGQDILANTELESQNRASRNRIISSNQLAAVNARGLPQLEAGRAEGQINLANAIRDLNDQIELSTNRQRGTIAQTLGQRDTADGINQDNRSILAEFISRDNIKPEDFKNLADTFKTSNETIYNTLIASYNELVSIKNNGNNTINEIQESNKRIEILNKAEERNRLLAGGQFNAGNTDALFRSRLTARTRNSGRGGNATQFNAINDQMALLDSLGFSETTNTRSLRESSRRQSVNISAADLLSQITGGNVGSSSEEINKEIDKFLSSIDTASASFQQLVDKDTVERIQRGLKSLEFTPEEQQKQLLNAGRGGAGAADAVSSGKLSFGEGSLITGIQTLGSDLKAPLDSINTNLGASGPIAKLLEQIKENRALTESFQQQGKLEKESSSLSSQITELRNRIDERRTQSVSFSDVNSGIKNRISQGNDRINKIIGESRGLPNSDQTKEISSIRKELQGLSGLQSFLKEQEKNGKTLADAIKNSQGNTDLQNKSLLSGEEIKSFFNDNVNKFSLKDSVTRDFESQITKLEERLSEVNDELLSIDFSKLSLDKAFVAPVFSKTNNSDGAPSNAPLTTGQSSLERKSTDTSPVKDVKGLIDKARLESQVTDKLAEQISISQQLANVNKELSDSANLSLKKRIALTNELLALELDLAREQGDSLKSLSLGFKQHFLTLKQQMNDLSDVGASVAQSLEGNLGNAFGDFVTGAKTGKEAFKSFVMGVLNDAARASASKAVQQLLGSAFGSYGGFSSGGSVPVKRAKGGEIPSFADGGTVPALVMGGEYYFNAEQTRSIGKGFLNQLNQGAATPYASGGLIKGGSGIKDDIPAQLDAGGYVIKKSSVNKYGSNYLDSLGNGSVQKKFWGGALIGAVSGAAIGYATAPKKDRKKAALYGAIGGAAIGGLSQNKTQTGNAFKSDPNAGTFSFQAAKPTYSGSSTGTVFDNPNLNGNVQSAPKLTYSSTSAKSLQNYYSGTGSGAAIPATSQGSPLKSAAINAGVAGALGIGAALLNKSGSPDTEEDALKAYREEEQRYNANLAKLRSGQGSAFINADTGYINGVGQGYSSRKFAKGGLIQGGSGVRDDLMTRLQSGGFVMKKSAVSRVGKGYLDKLAGGGQPKANINAYAEGGEVEGSIPETASVNINGMEGNKKASNNNAPQVYIKIDINNNGEISSSSESSNKSNKDETFGEDFAKRLEKQIRTTVKDELVQQSRVGGLDNKIKRTR